MHWIRFAVLVSVTACVGAVGVRTKLPTTVDGLYSLVRVGSRGLETRAQNQRSCSLRPYWGQMLLRSSEWTDTDSLFINCVPNGTAQLHVRSDSGTFRRRAGDTLDFFATAAGREPTVPVFTAVLRGTVLRVVGSDEGEGDYVYVRR